MKAASIKFLHNEHLEWLRDARHWEAELDFLTNLVKRLKNKNISESQEKAIGEYSNDIRHHKTLLNNLVKEINSHELFLKDLMDDAGVDIVGEEDLTDHNKHRTHINKFKATIRELKNGMFKLTEEII